MKCESTVGSDKKRPIGAEEDCQEPFRRKRVKKHMMNSPGVGVGVGVQRWEGLRRQELVLLMLQCLEALELPITFSELQKESGTSLERPEIQRLREAVQSGLWKEVTCALEVLEFPSPIQQACDFFVVEQKFLEFLSHEQSMEALECLREELAPLCFDEESTRRLHRCCNFLMCADPTDLEEQSGWTFKGSRDLLWERLIEFIPSDLVVPPARLAILLHQAYSYQEIHCMYHNASIPPSSYSLLQDHLCPQGELPSYCIGTLDAHTDEVWFIAISHDTQHLASCAKDRAVIIWKRAHSTFDVFHVLRGHADACSYLGWSEDDQHLATASLDNTVRIWHASSGVCVRVIVKHTDAVASVCWLHDSSRFLTAGTDKRIYLWNLESAGEEQSWVFSSRIQDISISNDGEKMLVVTSEKNVKVMDLATTAELYSLPESDPVTSICVSKTAEQVLVNISQHPATTRLWDMDQKKIVQRYRGHNQGRFVVRSCFGGSAETFVISGSEDSQVYIYNRHYGCQVATLKGHAGTVNCVAWAPNTSWMVSASDDSTIRIWSTRETREETFTSGGNSRIGNALGNGDAC